MGYDIVGLMQERHNSIANALELRLSCTNPIDMICYVQIARNSFVELELSCYIVHNQHWPNMQLRVADFYLGPLLLTWFNFNPSMDK